MRGSVVDKSCTITAGRCLAGHFIPRSFVPSPATQVSVVPQRPSMVSVTLMLCPSSGTRDGIFHLYACIENIFET